MKKLIIIAAMSVCTFSAFAKKVKFAVDMTGVTIATTGVHIMGDFQTIAGVGSDFVPTPIYQEGATDIYSLVVDIPAFAKYEYRFLSGDQTYEAEFVPLESRVGYDFDDNRWLYVDSLNNDTTFVGNIVFAGNAPAGLTLVRFVVDMNNEASVSTSRVHVAGNFQGWNTNNTTLYKFDAATVYEVISYVTNGTYEYKFYNGNTSGDAENVSASCAVNGNRQIQVSGDAVLSTVCFAACSDCSALGVKESLSGVSAKLFPNPTDNNTTIELKENASYSVSLVDQLGKEVKLYDNITTSSLFVQTDDLTKGMYFITVTNKTNLQKQTLKLILR